jgi:hypothetical protein
VIPITSILPSPSFPSLLPPLFPNFRRSTQSLKPYLEFGRYMGESASEVRRQVELNGQDGYVVEDDEAVA